MTQDASTPSSFCNVEPSDLGGLERIEEEQSIFKSTSAENWCVAWSQDCSYLAWSQGGGIVYLLPWNKYEGKLAKKPNRDRSYQDLTELDEEPVYIQNLPRLTTNDHQNDQDCNQSNDNIDRQCFRIDCMDNVWSMAFGSGVSKSSDAIWTRFHFKRDLILATGLQGGTIKLWDVYKGTLLMELIDHKSIVRGVSFTSDGSFRLVSCSNDCTLKFWDFNQDGNMYKTVRFNENNMLFGCRWSPNVNLVAAVGLNRCVYIVDTTNFQKPPLKLVGHLHTVCSCDFSSDAALLATASFDTRVIIWDSYTGDQIRSLGHLFPPPRPIYAGGANDHYVRSVSFSRDCQHVSTVADDGYLRIWDFHNESDNPECIAETTKPLACSYSPNGFVIATGLRDNGVLQLFKPSKPQVPLLQHLCRVVVRRNMPTHNVDFLYYPVMLKEYLKYREF